MTKDSTIRANFEGDSFNLTLSKNINAGGTVTGGGKIDCGNNSATITAEANDCYRFVNWTTTAGTQISTNATLNVTIRSDSTIRANFVKDSFDLTLNAYPIAGGTVTGAGRKDCGSNVAIIATVNENYRFISWTNSAGAVVSTDATYTFTITSDATYTANFETVSIEEVIRTGTINILPNPTSSDFTVSFDVIKSGNMKIVLTDLNGHKVLDIYDGFTVDGMFSKIVKITNLSKGVYFLNISIDKNTVIEKVILE
jgi:hypothetical protein